MKVGGEKVLIMLIYLLMSNQYVQVVVNLCERID